MGTNWGGVGDRSGTIKGIEVSGFGSVSGIGDGLIGSGSKVPNGIGEIC